MDYREYINDLKKDFCIVRTLSDNNGATVLLLKHNALGRKLVLRRYSSPVLAYDYLKNYIFENLPEVYDSFYLDDCQVVLEEYIDGITVADVLENGLYTYSGAKKVLFGICCALAPLHTVGIVHRDIKPENVIVSKEGCIKLIDFNASRKYSAEAKKDTVPIGTIGYAPPEQLGLAQSSVQTDVYALGVLLNVMLTGKHPSNCLAGGKAGKIVLKCTQIDPQSRYPSVEKLMAEL